MYNLYQTTVISLWKYFGKDKQKSQKLSTILINILIIVKNGRPKYFTI
jgi:hypothetical protein